jgi:cysteinyl-tRNA synthetase
MSWKHLGETFDIHGGGIDLMFPHHENEIAQSRCAFQTDVMANYWMHNGFLQAEGEKMSKSLGNFVTVRELLEDWHRRKWNQAEIRLVMLSTHYRQPIDWTLHGLEEARRIVMHWQDVTANVVHNNINVLPSVDITNALLDDLNTPGAISSLHDKAKLAARNSKFADDLYSDLVFLGLFYDRRLEDSRILSDDVVNRIKNDAVAGRPLHTPKETIAERVTSYMYDMHPTVSTVSVVTSLHGSLHVIFSDRETIASLNPWTKFGPKHISSEDIKYINKCIGIEELNSRIASRLVARQTKNFAESDRIRDELSAMGVVLKDSKDGTTWEVVR